MREQALNDIMLRLSTEFSQDQVIFIKNEISCVLSQYKISRESTEIQYRSKN